MKDIVEALLCVAEATYNDCKDETEKIRLDGQIRAYNEILAHADSTEKLHVYEIIPKLYCYSGVSFVAAKIADEANTYINAFMKSDKNNADESCGYVNVTESDIVADLSATKAGIVYSGIYYKG